VQRCGSQYGVFLSGRWVWFASHAKALEAERKDFAVRLRERQREGKTVILPAPSSTGKKKGNG